MNIIIRTTGERTEQACINSCKQQGDVHVIRAYPFGEAIRQTYELAIDLNQKWTPVIDADVIMYPDTIEKGVAEVGNARDVFCIDGRTDDKIMMKHRRAGIHIYRTEYLKRAFEFIDSNQLKPESHVRREMERKGFHTFTGRTIFGRHDYEQYYKDLWRKSVCQTKKLAKMIARSGIRNRWAEKALNDIDYRVILSAHEWAEKNNPEIFIDSRISYDAEENLQRLKIVEKKPIEQVR